MTSPIILRRCLGRANKSRSLTRALSVTAMTEAAPPGGGYMHVLPVILQAGMAVTHVSMPLLPWSSPSYGAVLGQWQGEPALAVMYEWPIPWLATAQDLDKYEREWLCLRRFSADQARAGRGHVFGEIRPGADPPDCAVATDAGMLGVESTSLAIEDRRGTHALFRNLRRQFITQDPGLFAKLAGNMVYVWFGDAVGSDLVKPICQYLPPSPTVERRSLV
jgi:hypothetical protein